MGVIAAGIEENDNGGLTVEIFLVFALLPRVIFEDQFLYIQRELFPCLQNAYVCAGQSRPATTCRLILLFHLLDSSDGLLDFCLYPIIDINILAELLQSGERPHRVCPHPLQALTYFQQAGSMIWQRPARLIRGKADGVIAELKITDGLSEIRGDFGLCFGKTTQSYGSSCHKICVSFRFQHLKDKWQRFFRETAMPERFEHITAESDYFVCASSRV